MVSAVGDKNCGENWYSLREFGGQPWAVIGITLVNNGSGVS